MYTQVSVGEGNVEGNYLKAYRLLEEFLMHSFAVLPNSSHITYIYMDSQAKYWVFFSVWLKYKSCEIVNIRYFRLWDAIMKAGWWRHPYNSEGRHNKQWRFKNWTTMIYMRNTTGLYAEQYSPVYWEVKVCRLNDECPNCERWRPVHWVVKVHVHVYPPYPGHRHSNSQPLNR